MTIPNPEPINEPTSKNPMIDLFISSMTGKSREQQIADGMCMTCKGEAKIFNSDLSRSDYRMSGMCQKCQDSVFK